MDNLVPLTAIEKVAPVLVRGFCVFGVLLSVMVCYILADIWRLERRRGKIASCVAIASLASGVIMCAIIFGQSAISGCLPQPPQERITCP